MMNAATITARIARCKQCRLNRDRCCWHDLSTWWRRTNDSESRQGRQPWCWEVSDCPLEKGGVEGR